MPFVKGQSGNPGGRSKQSAYLKHLCSTFDKEGFEILRTIARNDAADDADRIKAVMAIHERAHGKPAQEINATVDVNDTSYEDVNARVASILASAGVETDTGSMGEPH